MKSRPRLTRKTVLLAGLFLLTAIPLSYLLIPEVLVWSATLLVAETEAFPADAIVILGGGAPGRAREAADLYRAGLAPTVGLTTGEPPDGYEEMSRLGIELVRSHENYLRVLKGFGVPEESIIRIEEPVTETMNELTRVREFARERNWTSLIIVTSNYHTRRSLLITKYLFDSDWRIAVVGSRHDGFRPNDWWQEVRHIRTFLIEFEKLLVYEMYIQPRLWF